MPLAAKHFDLVVGIDVHIVQPPGTVPPAPIPHPFAGILFDPFDYAPVFGATVMINGVPRAQAGSAGLPIPSHIPIGGVFVKPVGNECELFMGSSKVAVDGEPLGYMGLPVLSCSDVGTRPPPRPPKNTADAGGAKGGKKSKPKRKGPVGMVLPTSVVFSVPIGTPVMVGGPPTISLSAVAGRAAFAATGAGLRKLRALQKQSKRAKTFSDRLHRRAKTVLDRLGVSESTRHKVHKSLCSLTGHPVDIATGKVIAEAVDIDLPGPLPFVLERTWYSTSTYRGPLGHGWHHNFDLALTIDNDLTVVRLADGRTIAAPGLAVGESWFDRREKLGLQRRTWGWELRDKQGLNFCFVDPGLTHGGVVELAAIEDASGNRVELSRDEQGRLEAITDSGGRRLAVECDAEGRVVEIRGPHPETSGEIVLVRYVYDRAGDLVEVHDPLGGVTRYAYQDHLLVRETNRTGLSFYFEYDNLAGPHSSPDPLGPAARDARCLRTWGDGGIYDHRLEYAPDHTVVTNSLGARDTYFFNAEGLVERAVDPLGHSATVVYDEWNNKLEETDELGRTTRFCYDERGNLVEQTWADGTTARFAHDDNDRLIQAIDQNGGWWQWRRDQRGRLLARLSPDGGRTRLIWEGARLGTIVDAHGGATILEYDEAGNLTRANMQNGAVASWSYDRLGRCVRTEGPRGELTRLRRDLAGRILEIEESDGTRRLFSRDAEGRTVRVREPQRELELSWAGLGQLVARREGGVETRFTYDTEEQVVGLVNAHGDRYVFERDARGDVIAEIGWAGDRRELERDPAGQIRRIIQASGAQVEYGWTRAGKLERVGYEDGSFERFVYRADGLLTLAHNDTCTIQLERDPLGRITQEWQDEHGVESRFDARGERVALRSSFGFELDIERDAMGRWSRMAVNEDGQARWSAAARRDLGGEEVELVLPGGARSRWGRDPLGRPTQHQVWDGGEVVRDARYGWDVDDRLSMLLDALTGERAEFHHDALGRLAWTRKRDATELRIPDALGNIYRSGDRVDRLYGADGRLLLAEESEGAVRYEYDTDGRRVRRLDPDGGEWSYRWNCAGRLAAVVRPNGEVVEFGYDALGRRVWKRFRGLTTRWVWDGDVILHEWTAGEVAAPDDSPVAVDDDHTSTIAPAFVPLPSAAPRPAAPGYVADDDETGYVEPAFVSRAKLETGRRPAPAGLITWVTDPETLAPRAKVVGRRAYSVVCDHLGTPVLMLDEAGGRTWQAEVSSWGEVRVLRGDAADCPHRFVGQYEDVETGLYYNRHRYYDPAAGQYLCVDPIRLAGGLNSFAYVGDPLTELDPLGLAKVRATSCATSLPLIEPGTRAWDDAARTLRAGGKSDFRVPTATDAKALLQRGRGKMNRYKRYTDKKYKKGYEVHPNESHTRRASHNDLPHVKWKDWLSQDAPGRGHIFFDVPN